MFEAEVNLVFGVVLCLLAIPSFFSALIDKRVPLASFIVVVIGGVLIFWAHLAMPGGLSWPAVPEAFVHVVALLVR